MFDSFAHYLSYGATDQLTARELDRSYDGLLIPGTVAAFQNEGTRGFVLTLSQFKHVPYAIDPRFPLFQQRLPEPRKSHEMLANLLGVPDLVNRHGQPTPEQFTDEWVSTIADQWLEFNGGYTTVSNKHFKKYAERLGEDVVQSSASGPDHILVPYTVAQKLQDPWWRVSERLWEAHAQRAGSSGQSDRLVRVVAADGATNLAELLTVCAQERVAIWANALDELDTSAPGQRALRAYRDAIRFGTKSDKLLFALYGGFFAVLMASFGLKGASNGIGYGEARTWVELPQSGPPPARYYVPKAHRYVSQDLAEYFWKNARGLISCECSECAGGNPGLLDYHGLMKHSVRCRNAEISVWPALSPTDAATRLRTEAGEFRTQLAGLFVPQPLARQAQNCFAHLDGWADVLESP